LNDKDRGIQKSMAIKRGTRWLQWRPAQMRSYSDSRLPVSQEIILEIAFFNEKSESQRIKSTLCTTNFEGRLYFLFDI